MSLLVSLKSELLKTKRSPAWILTLVMAAFAPVFMLLIFKEQQDGQVSDDIVRISKDPWGFYYYQGWGIISVVFLPMFVVLISTLLPQIEYRNHTWKQVFASPQSYGKLYISKFLIFQLFILAFIIIHLLLVGASGLISGSINPKFKFDKGSLDIVKIITDVSKTYVAILALSTFQFWMGIRFKSFVVPIGIGVLVSILGMINMIGYKVIDGEKFFYNFSAFIVFKENAAKVPTVLWTSAAGAAIILLLGLIDFSRIKER